MALTEKEIEQGIVVLSLFDGMSCGLLALRRAGIKVKKYIASEVDKYAIKVSSVNNPEIIHVGDVTKVKGTDFGKIDLLIGGSPCQGFSIAGKQLNFDDPRSKLFFEYVRILNEIRIINPDVKFLLENVIMSFEFRKIITRYLDIEPIQINAALVSAQNRDRNFWTNIYTVSVGLFDQPKCMIPAPKDRGIYLRDILEDNVPEKYYMSNVAIEWIRKHKESQVEKGNGFGAVINDGDSKSPAIIARYYKDGKDSLVKVDRNDKPKSNQDKASCFTAGANSGGNHSDMDLIIELKGTLKFGRTEEAKKIRSENIRRGKDYTPFQKKEVIGIDINKMNTITAHGSKDNLLLDDYRVRKLTETEVERLQGVPDGYTNHVSSSQRYKMLGNGWNVDVITHIFSYLLK